MSITIDTDLPALSLARNPMGMEMSTDNYIVNAGTNASFVVEYTAKTANGDTMQWTFADGTVITMTAVATPDDSGTQFEDSSLAGTVLDWVVALADWLNENYYLSEHYTITGGNLGGGNPKITLIAKEKGSDWDISSYTMPTGTINIVNTAATAVNVSENFKLIVEPFLEKGFMGNIFERVAILEHTPDSNQVVKVHLDEIISAFLSGDVPAAAANTLERDESLIKRFYLRYYERFGDPEAEQKVYVTDTVDPYRALLAGLDFDDFPGHTFLADFLGKWLTWHPSGLDVFSGQPLYLSFLAQADVATVKLKSVVYYDDATSATTTHDTYTAAKTHEIFHAPAGHDQLALDTVTAGKVITHWDIFLTDGSDVDITNRFRFYLEVADPYNIRYLLFLSSLGAWESLAGTGNTAKEIDSQFEVNRKALDYDYTALDGELDKNAIENAFKLNFRSGYFDTKEELERYADILNSKQVYELVDGSWQKIIITSNSVSLYDENTDVYVLDLEYIAAHKEPAYSE
jgi:hypothetical protein